MRLVIHCGCHKTGTTSFQNYCDINRTQMLRFGIFYPNLDSSSQHSGLMWRIQAKGLTTFRDFLQDCHADVNKGCHTVLLSGEDFENAIVDLTLASDIEAQARDAGFDEILWVAVSRDKYDYAASIYSEMSQHNVVLHRSVVTEALEQRGCLYVSNHNFNYIFVLDFLRFRERFEATITGNLWEYSMECFVAGEPGSVLLKRLMGKLQYKEFEETAQKTTKVHNKRISSRKVERNYLATGLGLTRERKSRLPWTFILSIASLLKIRG